MTIHQKENRSNDAEEPPADDGFTKAKSYCRTLERATYVAALWGYFWPHPLQLVIAIWFLLPIIALFVLRHFEDTVRFNPPSARDYPNVTTPFMLPPIFLAAKTLHWQVLEWSHVWVPCAVFLLALFSLSLFLGKEIRMNTLTAIYTFLFCAVYGYGAAIDLNGIMDTSSPTTYQAIVLSKDDSRRPGIYGNTHYDVKLSAWGPRNSPDNVEVTHAVYDDYSIGASVTVYVRKGGFGIPYFYSY